MIYSSSFPYDPRVVVEFYAFREGARLPSRSTREAAGYDVYAVVDSPVEMAPESTAIIPTGLNLCIPEGYEVQIRSRSGLAAKSSVFVLNSPGTIDSDYHGVGEKFELKVILHNASQDKSFVVNTGDRVAQLVIKKLPETSVRLINDEDEFLNLRPDHDRSGGLGSTGVSSQ